MEALKKRKKVLLLSLLAFAVFFVLFGNKNPDQDTTLSVRHEKIKRTFDVHLPDNYDPKATYPVVVGFHGGGGESSSVNDWGKLNAKSNEAGFIAVYPQGEGTRFLGKIFGVWNTGACCPPEDQTDADRKDDIGFIDKMLDKLTKTYNIDEKRIYATGISNGAMMSYRLACEMSSRFAAIAPIGAVAPLDKLPDCNPERNVPIIHFHGTDDRCALYNGGMCGGCFHEILDQDTASSKWACPAVVSYIDQWKSMYSLPHTGEIVYQKGNATCISYNDESNSEIQLCTIKNMGHNWPGGDYGKVCAPETLRPGVCAAYNKFLGKLNNDISANDVMWEFFEKHSID